MNCEPWAYRSSGSSRCRYILKRSNNYADKFGAIAGLTVSGANAYLTFDRNCCTSPLGGLIVNISNPAHLKLAGSLPSSASSVDIVGHYAYLADRNILRVFDVSRTDRPVLLAAYVIPRGLYAQTGRPPLKSRWPLSVLRRRRCAGGGRCATPTAPSLVGAYITLTYCRQRRSSWSLCVCQCLICRSPNFRYSRSHKSDPSRLAARLSGTARRRRPVCLPGYRWQSRHYSGGRSFSTGRSSGGRHAR